MNMKLTIGKKLTICFLCLALLVLLSGLVGVVVLNKVSRSADTVAKEKVPVQYAVMKANILVEKTKEAITNFTNSTSGLDEKREILIGLLDEFDMWIRMLKLGTGSDKFKTSNSGSIYTKNNLKIIVPQGSAAILPKVENVLKESAIFRSSVNELIAAHNEYLSYSVTLEAKNYDLPSFLRILREDHQSWVKALLDAVNATNFFKGGTDPQKSLIGVWINAYRVEDETLMKLVSTMDKYNRKLKKQAVTINSTRFFISRNLYFVIGIL